MNRRFLSLIHSVKVTFFKNFNLGEHFFKKFYSLKCNLFEIITLIEQESFKKNPQKDILQNILFIHDKIIHSNTPKFILVTSN